MKFNTSIVFGFQGNREMKTYSLPSEETIDSSVREKYKPELAANPGSEVTFYNLAVVFALSLFWKLSGTVLSN